MSTSRDSATNLAGDNLAGEVSRFYLDITRGRRSAAVLHLTDARALELLARGWKLAPIGWTVAELWEETRA